MANVAQLVNCLHSLFFAHEDKFCTTPTYHVFAMYAAHQGAKALRTVFSAPTLTYSRNSQPASLPGLSGSASINGKQVTLTVTNPSLDRVRETEIAIREGVIKSVRAVTLVAGDVHAHNSFENPRAVEPKSDAISVRATIVTHNFPPASVTKLEITLV
jgi:alpha-N-arabinofuranosidase